MQNNYMYCKCYYFMNIEQKKVVSRNAPSLNKVFASAIWSFFFFLLFWRSLKVAQNGLNRPWSQPFSTFQYLIINRGNEVLYMNYQQGWTHRLIETAILDFQWIHPRALCLNQIFKSILISGVSIFPLH